MGYILELNDFQKLGKIIEKSKKFKPKRFESNTHNMIKLIENYIEDSNHTSWFNRTYPLAYYGMCAIINYLLFWILSCFSIPILINVGISWFLTSILAVIVNKSYQRKIVLLLPLLFLLIDISGFIILKISIYLVKLLVNTIIIVFGIRKGLHLLNY